MPVEIRELVIRATVREADQAKTETARSDVGGGSDAFDTTALVEECVRQVLKILRREKER
jgi:hypothetical protein